MLMTTMNNHSLGPYQIHGSKVSHLITPDVGMATYEKHMKCRMKKSLKEHYSKIQEKETKELTYPSAVDLQKLYYSKEFIESNGRIDPTISNFNEHRMKTDREFNEKSTQKLSVRRKHSKKKKMDKELKNTNPTAAEESVLDGSVEQIVSVRRKHSIKKKLDNELKNVNPTAAEESVLEGSVEQIVSVRRKHSKKKKLDNELKNVNPTAAEESMLDGSVEQIVEPINVPSNEHLNSNPVEESTETQATDDQAKNEDVFGEWPEFKNEDDKFAFLKEKLEKLEAAKKKILKEENFKFKSVK